MSINQIIIKMTCTKVPTEKKLHRTRITEYKKQLRNYLMTSRFNDATWNENTQYRKQNPSVGCIYCCPDPIAKIIPVESIMFILEMNNDNNKIMGIGMVRNHPIVQKYTVYSDGNYNRYVFIGKNYISRLEMTGEEERIMKLFDVLCFSGNKHMKRGQGLKSFPIDMLYRMSNVLDLVNFIGEMFKHRLTPTVSKQPLTSIVPFHSTVL